VQVKEWPLEARRSMKGKIDAIIGVAKLREIVASLNGELHCYHQWSTIFIIVEHRAIEMVAAT
jgi:hypothetical protein